MSRSIGNPHTETLNTDKKPAELKESENRKRRKYDS